MRGPWQQLIRGPWRVEGGPGSGDELSPLQAFAFDLNGFMLLDGALEPRRVERLRAAVEAQPLPAPDHSIEHQRFGQAGSMFEWDHAFVDLIDHPWVLAVLRHLIGPHVRLDYAYGIIMAPGTSGLGLHGPAEPWDPAQYYVARRGALRSGLLGFSWSLSDSEPGQGGFGCIPGSHKASMPVPHGGDSLVVEVPQPAGSLLVFTEALYHCTLPWTGPSKRLVLMLKYSPGNSAWDRQPAAPADTVARMSFGQRLFFQPPSVGGRLPLFDV